MHPIQWPYSVNILDTPNAVVTLHTMWFSTTQITIFCPYAFMSSSSSLAAAGYEAFQVSSAFVTIGKRLRWSRGSVLAFGTKVRGFKPGRSRRIFQVEKILSTPSFGREVKPFVPCPIFAACNRTPESVCVEVTAFGRNFRSFLAQIFPPSLLGSLVETSGGASRND